MPSSLGSGGYPAATPHDTADAAHGGDHLAAWALHDHEHEHDTPEGRMVHSHPHGHRGDGLHMAADPDHQHVAADLASLRPVPKRGKPAKSSRTETAAMTSSQGHTVIRRRAAAQGGHDPDELAAMYAQQGDEVLVSLSAPLPDDTDAEVMLSAEDVLTYAAQNGLDPLELAAALEESGMAVEPIELTAPSAIDGSHVAVLSAADLEGAEAELAEQMTSDTLAMSAATEDDPAAALAADTVAGEVNRLSMLHQQGQLRSMGRRGF